MAWCIYPWVWRLRIPAHRKHVLKAFAECADEYGYTHCSIPTVAWMTCADEKTVRASVKWLILHKLLIPTGQMVGRSAQVPEYHIPFVLIDPKAPKRPNAGQDIAVDFEHGPHNPPAWEPPLPNSAPVNTEPLPDLAPVPEPERVDIPPVPETAPVTESPLPNPVGVDKSPVPETAPVRSEPLPNPVGVNPPLPNLAGVNNSPLSVYNVSFSVDNPVDNGSFGNFRNTFDPSQISRGTPPKNGTPTPTKFGPLLNQSGNQSLESISEPPTASKQRTHNTQANVLEDKNSPTVPDEKPSQKHQFGSRRLARLEQREQFAQQRQEAADNPPPPPPPNSHGKVAQARAKVRSLPSLDEYIAGVEADREAKGQARLSKAAIRLLRHEETQRRKTLSQNLHLPGLEVQPDQAGAEIG